MLPFSMSFMNDLRVSLSYSLVYIYPSKYSVWVHVQNISTVGYMMCVCYAQNHPAVKCHPREHTLHKYTVELYKGEMPPTFCIINSNFFLDNLITTTTAKKGRDGKNYIDTEHLTFIAII